MSKLLRSILSRQISFTLGAERQVWVAGLLFLAALSTFEWLRIGIGFPGFVAELSRGDDLLYTGIGVFYIVISLYISFAFFISCFASRWIYRPIYIAIFGLAVMVEYGYANALGRFTNFYDIVSAISATPQQSVDSIYAYFDIRAVIPFVLFVGLNVLIRNNKESRGGTRLFAVFLAIGIFYVHFFYVNQLFFDRMFVSSSFGSFWQTTADYLMLNPFGRMRVPKRLTVDISGPEPALPSNNVIFIFDESIRGDHLSLNGYSRPTTPYLEDLAKQGILLNWGIAVSASTISHPSYDAMISGATPELLESKGYDEINVMPTLFQFAKSMKYRTHLIDGQMKKYWGGNPDDLNYIDDFISMKEIGGIDRFEDWERGPAITNEDNQNNSLKQWEIDGKVAKIVNGIFSNSTGNFVFVYKRGAHFPYEKNYPEAAATWKPVYRFKNQYEIPPGDQYDAIVNSYDNAIQYNLDAFFRQLSPDLSDLPNGTVIIYTADHGESFFANGKAGHGGITKEEAAVPLFMLGLKDRNPDTHFPATHANIFTTLLDLLNVPADARKYPYLISLFEGNSATPVKRFYNPPPGKKYAYD